MAIMSPTADGSASPPVVVPLASARTQRHRELAELFRREHRSLVRLAALLVDDVGAAEEIVQDAFVALDRSWGEVRERGRVDAYMRSIVLNGARARMRRRVVERKHQPAPARSAPGADEAVLRSAEAAEVLAAVRTLPHRQREVIVLRYWSDLPLTGIADELDISVGSVKTHLHRATAAVAARLEGTR